MTAAAGTAKTAATRFRLEPMKMLAKYFFLRYSACLPWCGHGVRSVEFEADEFEVRE